MKYKHTQSFIRFKNNRKALNQKKELYKRLKKYGIGYNFNDISFVYSYNSKDFYEYYPFLNDINPLNVKKVILYGLNEKKLIYYPYLDKFIYYKGNTNDIDFYDEDKILVKYYL